MKNQLLAPSVTLALLLTSACGPNVAYHRDAQTPIPSSARWAWGQPDADGVPARAGGRTPDDSTAQLLRSAIERELDDRGYRRTSRDSADFLVHFHVGQREVFDTLPPPSQPELVVVDRDRGWWGGSGSPEAMGDRAAQWSEGKLIVDVVTPDGRKIAWRGEISGEIPSGARKNPGKEIRAAVEKLMRGFP
ncbi:MAG: DUF4136 domain-containing protein [Gemmatimonadaceae bacterium]